MPTHFYQLNYPSWYSVCIVREAHTTFFFNLVDKMQVFYLACVSKSSVKPNRKPFLTGKINLFDISVRVLTLCSCVISRCNQRILFLICHRYKLSIYSVHAMSILFMLAQATAYNLLKLDGDSINDKIWFEDKFKATNLFYFLGPGLLFCDYNHNHRFPHHC